MTSFTQASRALARRRGFTLATILTLAAGIAVTTTMFAIVNGVLLRPLPYPDAGQLVALYESSPGQGEQVSLVAPVRLEEWTLRSRAFSSVSGSYTENVTDTSGTEPERLDGRRVMPRFFDVFGVRPLLGRTFVREEEQFGGTRAVVISEGFWTRRFARSPRAVGARLIVGGTGYTIVGVMPRAFTAAATDVWVPAQLRPEVMRIREARFLVGVGRMRAGITIPEAQGDLSRVQAALGAQYPETDRGWSAEARDLKEIRIEDHRRPLVVVFGAVALLFAITVANVAGLMLVQLHRRASEFAVRAAIGASRWQIVRVVMQEVLLLALAGAAGGVAAAYWLSGIAAAAFSAIPGIAEVEIDMRVLGFVALVTVAATAVFGLLPALFATRMTMTGRGETGRRHRLQAAIVVAQLALGVVLAGSAGLLLRSYGAMTSVESGFDPGGVLTFHVGAAWNEDRVRVGQLQVRVLSELERLPGVRAVGYANFLPATGATLRSFVVVQGLSSPERNGAFTVGQRTVTPGYLQALSVPLVAGQWCADVRADFLTQRVRDVMVNHSFVERFAPGQNVIGRRLSFSQQGGGAFQIAGVIGDVREDGPAAPVVPYVYTCLAAGSWPDPQYVVRSAGDPRALAGAVRDVVKSLDASRPVFGLKPLTDVMDAALDQPRLNATALGTFAAAALGLAALGLYGLLMLLVAQRRRELGVRLALGASPRDLARVVIAGAGRLVAAGIALGLLLTLAAGYLLRSVLFGVASYDPRALAGSVAALALAALAAMVIPARQAARTNAIEAMKT
jgi:predicted permease